MATIAAVETKVEVDPQLLTGIEEKGFTIVHCDYCNGRYAWATIHATTYLLDPLTSEKVQLLHALNIPVAPQKHYFDRQNEQLNFTLIFPKLPPNWDVFNLVEVAGALSFHVPGIPKNNAGVYRVKIR